MTNFGPYPRLAPMRILKMVGDKQQSWRSPSTYMYKFI